MPHIKKKELLIDKYLCVRLRDDSENKAMLRGFNNERNPSLGRYLQTYAWKEDKDNYRAYYLVKEDNRIVLYFSLQCGLLVKCSRKRLGGITHKATGDNVEYYVDNDKINVTKVIPAIELAHFCVNDSYRRRKSHWGIQRGLYKYSVGEYAFYKFIAPKIIELSNIAGSQYVYLFCADDGSTDLLRYYVEKLNFELIDDMSCIRPDYDDSLECLIIKIDDLIRDSIRFDDKENISAVIEYLKAYETISNHQAKKSLGIKDPSFLFLGLIEHKLAEAVTTTSDGEVVRIKRHVE